MKFKPKTEDSRNFLKLKANETISGIFRGDIYEFRTHWAENRSTVCPGKDSCPLCRSGDKSKFRFRVNFIVKEDAGYAAKIVEQGWTFYDLLRTINDGDYELEKFVMKISRHGTGLNTSYSVIPTPNGLVSPATELKLKEIALNELGHITESETEPISEMGKQTIPPISDDDIPF